MPATRARIPAARQLTARTLTDAESQRRRRKGHRAPAGKGSSDPVWQEPPVNGRPFKPYIYKGNGPFASEEW